MFDSFFETICRTGVFIICAQVLVHFRPKASYEKYLKMLVSAMILIQLLLPVGELLTEDGQAGLAERVVWFEEELDKCVEAVTQDIELERKALESREITQDAAWESHTSLQEADREVSTISIPEIQIRLEGAQSDAEIDTGNKTGDRTTKGSIFP